MAENEKLEKQMLFNDQYLVLKKLGQGGFGVVWEAFDFSLKNFVAIKELLDEFAEPKFIEMFYKEALIAKNLIHDNIVRVQHFWKGDNGSYYIAMDYVVGKDLHYVLKKCNEKGISLPWGVTVFVTGAILKALDYANRFAKDATTGKPYGLVYRDASPGNVMIFYDGSVKISDFGIAKTAEELQKKSKKKVVTGKYAYMSPEQIEGEHDIDHRSDIFSVGIILYEMLSGQSLFTGDLDTIRKRIVESKPNLEPLKTLNMPEGLIDIVSKALEKDKEKRYQSALEMFRDLRRLLKFRESEELQQDLSNFMNAVLVDEIADENKFLETVRQINIADIKANPNVVRITSKDFIMGDLDSAPKPAVVTEPPKTVDASLVEDSVKKDIEKRLDNEKIKEKIIIPDLDRPKTAEKKPLTKSEVKLKPKQGIIEVQKKPDQGNGEERGKTVFEEVGDWLARKYKSYKKTFIRVSIVLLVAAVLFVIVDTFTFITPMGRSIYSWLYPPDIIITTVPSGAKVSVQTRSNKIIASNQDSSMPIELRKIQPDTYFITAYKEGFKPIERIKKIEDKNSRGGTQTINLVFEFVLNINSEPSGAEVVVDANKRGYTPCKIDLIAGEHTVKLYMPGFEELGSEAKEIKEGQCSLDFTKPSESAVFANIDSRYWKARVLEDNGVKIFDITGQLFKRIDIDSVPRNVMLYIDDKSINKLTPQTLSLKAGSYKVKFVDPNGKYEEAVRTVKVDKDSDKKTVAYLNHWVQIGMMAENDPLLRVTATLKVTGQNIVLSKTITNEKSLKIALPSGKYRFSFEPQGDFEPVVMKDININEQADIKASLKFKNTILKVVVLDQKTSMPIPDTYVWIGTNVNKTDRNGVWQYTIKRGTETVKIVANGYNEQTRVINIEPGKKDGMLETFLMEREKPDEEIEPKVPDRRGDRKPEVSTEKIICQNCGKQYDINQKKLKFCLNCGKPLKWGTK